MPRQPLKKQTSDDPVFGDRQGGGARAAELNDIRDLFSFQLQRLAGLSTRIATLSIRPHFGITAREWRALAVLDYLGPAPLHALARHSGVATSQMSRTVAALIERGFVRRSSNPEDGRSVLLSLTPQGFALAVEVLGRSWQRNERMLAALSSAERHMLTELLGKVFRTSLSYLADVKAQAPADSLNDEDD